MYPSKERTEARLERINQQLEILHAEQINLNSNNEMLELEKSICINLIKIYNIEETLVRDSPSLLSNLVKEINEMSNINQKDDYGLKREAREISKGTSINTAVEILKLTLAKDLSAEDIYLKVLTLAKIIHKDVSGKEWKNE